MAKKANSTEVPLDKRLIWSGIIIVLALAVRLVFLFNTSESTVFGFLSYDRLYYEQIAQQFLAGQPFGPEILFKPQLYPLYVGVVLQLLGRDLFLPLLIQGFLGAFSCALVFLIALRFYSLKISATAGIITALYGTLIYYSGELLPVTLLIFLNLSVIYLLLRYNDTRNLWYAFFAGLSLGFAVAAGPSSLLLLAAILVWIFRRRSKRKLPRGKEAAIVLVGVMLVFTPFWLRALTNGGEEVPYATHIGLTLAAGNNIDARGNTINLPRTIAPTGFDYDEMVELAQRANLGERPLDQLGSLWTGQAIGFALHTPGKWLLLELRKLGYIFMGYENWRHKPLYYFSSHSDLLGFLLWDNLISFPFGVILPLALILLFAPRSEKPGQGLLLGYAAVGVIVLLASYVVEGQRLIFIPPVIIWAAAGLWTLIDSYREKQFKRFYKLAVVFVVALGVSNGLTAIPGLSPRVIDEAVGEVYIANALISLEQYPEAEQRLQRALRYDSRSASANMALATIYSRRGQIEEAMKSYRRASHLSPESQLPKQAIANLLQQMNKLEELNHYIVGIIRENPKENWAQQFYADMHARIGEYMQAADILERAYQADSTYFDAILLKANVYIQADMRVEAEKELNRFLEFMPNSIEAHANLGQVYARQQRYDLALKQFTAARDAQPWNPAAYFNLATLSYQMGQFNRAHAYLDTVLIINPDFPSVDVMRAKIDSTQAAFKN